MKTKHCRTSQRNRSQNLPKLILCWIPLIFLKVAKPDDYHGMFDTKYFVALMVILLDALEARDINNVVIVIENSKYHKTLPEGTPKIYWKNQQLI